MVFNATFNNISVISWRSVLLVEETLSHNVVSSTSRLSGIRTYLVIGTSCIDSYISNYHTMTTAPIIGSVKIRRLKWPSAMVKVYIAASWEIHYHLSQRH